MSSRPYFTLEGFTGNDKKTIVAMQTTLDDLGKKDAEIDTRLAGLDKKDTDVDAKIADLGKKIANIDAKITGIDKKITDLGKKDTDIGKKVDDLVKKDADVYAKIAAFDKKVTELKQPLPEPGVIFWRKDDAVNNLDDSANSGLIGIGDYTMAKYVTQPKNRNKDTLLKLWYRYGANDAKTGVNKLGAVCNDDVASVTVNPRTDVYIYQHDNFGGKCIHLHNGKDIPWVYNLKDDGLKDQLSSYKIRAAALDGKRTHNGKEKFTLIEHMEQEQLEAPPMEPQPEAKEASGMEIFLIILFLMVFLAVAVLGVLQKFARGAGGIFALFQLNKALTSKD
jgi:hypothetical protein